MTYSANPNGQTSVVLSTELVNALSSLNVHAGGFGNTQITDGVAIFPIIGGATDLDSTRVEVSHSGGLSFRAGDTEVNLTDFVISNLEDGTVLTGLVSVNGDIITRAPLFNLEIGSIGTSEDRGGSNLDIDNVNVTLTDVAANVLNEAFGVTAFVPDFNIGTAKVDALFDPSNGNISDGRLPIIDFIDDSLLFSEASQTQDVLPAGRTYVELSDSLVNALGDLNVQATGFGGTHICNGVADFLITGGATDLDNTEVEIFHKGGLTFTTGDTEVNLTDFVINNVDSEPVLTGTVIANDSLVTRIPLFDLELENVGTKTKGIFTNLDLTDVNVNLSEQAATALNDVFSVDAFSSGFNIGTAQVDAFVV
ncbi:hypothetical protein [Mastigocoleus testarum]|uniref:Uncharacterized protein n=1 Tax=Mastigocoleus testarum BC008 TaxID=371196 RepID=A0A0V7ZGU0_9CYAN|nr:hypothetical protein [Mastigocoleus testarum]KST63720.1 hypothetical protein BC008_14780 [Mastigocoleus testarum BC008]KST69216.1 hypothetical protein BC008_03235 [Mastigocoleus testarum BC008]